jgi:DNA-binding response OmpR family regulator
MDGLDHQHLKADGLKTILVVEDDNEISFILKTFLEREGYQIQVAENGQVALEVVAKYGVPHLILLDMKMPVMNGWQFANEFEIHYDGKTPIVVMTAAADVAQRARDIKAKDWIGKPFSLTVLLSKIKNYETRP